MLLVATPIQAHRVTIFAWVENGNIMSESYFPDGRAVQKGTVSVLDSNNELVLTGETDDEGMFSFPVPKIDDLTITLDASAGHRATVTLSREEIEHAAPFSATERRGAGNKALNIGKVLVGIASIAAISGIAMFMYRKRKH
jgi:nickel transport protein